jgi:hypothetical protein
MAKTFLIVDGDVAYSTAGSPKTIEGKPKTRQDLGEMLAIEVQPDGFGAGIGSIIDQQSFDDGMDTNLEFLIRERLSEAATRFIGLQRRSASNRIPAEIVARVVNIDAGRSDVDPRTYRWRIDFQTQDNQYSTLRGKLGA